MIGRVLIGAGAGFVLMAFNRALVPVNGVLRVCVALGW